MKALLSRTQLRQRPMLAVYAGLLILIAAVIGVWALRWLSSASSDHLTVISNLLSLGTLLLALVAGIVALAAYSAATGLPNLELQLILPGSRFRNVMMIPRQVVKTAIDFPIEIAVKNTTKYAARTPAVMIELEGAVIKKDAYSPSGETWRATTRKGTGDIKAVQWDGGPSYAIHGNSTRWLPDLNLKGLVLTEKEPKILISLLADGYDRRPKPLPIGFIDGGPIFPPGEHPVFLPAEHPNPDEWL
jgi:hypothetical protein